MKLPLNKILKGKTLALAIAVVLCLIIDTSLLYSFLSAKTQHERLSSEIKELQTLGREYLKLKASQEAIKQKAYNLEDPPTVALDGIASKTGITQKIVALKNLPERTIGQWSVSSMELQLKDLTIDDLYRFLAELDRKGIFFVRNLRVKRQFGSENLLQTSAEVFVVKEKE